MYVIRDKIKYRAKVRTKSQEDKTGFTDGLRTTEDVDMLLWRMAFMGYDMARGFRNAMVELTNSCEMIDYIDFRCHQYNHVLGNQRGKRGNYMLEELKKKHKAANKTITDLENKLKGQ